MKCIKYISFFATFHFQNLREIWQKNIFFLFNDTFEWRYATSKQIHFNGKWIEKYGAKNIYKNNNIDI